MSDLASIVGDLARAFPRDKRDLDTWRFYQRMLADIPVHVLQETILEIVCTHAFPTVPSIAEIRRLASERQLLLPLESEALTQVERRVAWGREHDGDRPDLHPLVGEALAHVGGVSGFKESENPSIIRSQFLKLYRELREQCIRERQVVHAFPPAVGAFLLPAAASG